MDRISTNCGCSVTKGACDEHKVQSRIASSASAVNEADEVALAAVVKALDAVEVAPGYYAWKLNEGATRPTWVVANVDDLLTIRIDGMWPEWPTNEETNEPDNRAVMMPSWWSPERRKTTRCTGCGKITQTNHCIGKRIERITADLTTGAEVPA